MTSKKIDRDNSKVVVRVSYKVGARVTLKSGHTTSQVGARVAYNRFTELLLKWWLE